MHGRMDSVPDCRYLVADEYQDTSMLQHQLILAAWKYSRPILTVVGDSDQAIYGFAIGAGKALDELPNQLGSAAAR